MSGLPRLSISLPCGGTGLIRVVWEMPEKLVEEADFTLNGVNDVERFLKWLSQTAVELN